MKALLLALVLAQGDVTEAERAYRAGRFEEAIAMLQRELSEPRADEATLLYDLGNCAFRLERYAEAVLFYRRAERRLPGDRDTSFNRRLAERRLGLTPPPEPRLDGAALAWLGSFSPLALLLLASGLQCLGLAGMRLFRTRRAPRAAAALLALLGLTVAARLASIQWLGSGADAIVLVPEIQLRSAPRSDAAVTHRLHAGQLVQVEERQESWLQVEHDGSRGWAESPGLGIVD